MICLMLLGIEASSPTLGGVKVGHFGGMLHSKLENLFFCIAAQAISKRRASHWESRDYASIRGLYCNPIYGSPHIFMQATANRREREDQVSVKDKKQWHNRDYVGTWDARGRQVESFRHNQYPSILRRSFNVCGQQV